MTIADVRAAVDDLGRAFETFKSANDTRLAQVERRGAADPLTDAGVARLSDALGDLQERVDRFETAMRRAPKGTSGGRHDPAHAEHKALFARFLRKGVDDGLAAQEQKALSVGSDPEGGYAVPTALADRVVTVVFESSPLRAVANVIAVGGDSAEFLVDKDEAAASWVGETATRAETDTPDLAKAIIPVHELYAEPRITQKLLDDASFEVEAWLAERIAEKFARAEATAFVAGDGVGKPRGITSYPAGTAWGQIQQVNSGSSGAVTADGLIDLQGALKSPYVQGAAFVMKRATLSAIRKLKDTTNQYLWQPGLAQGQPETLLGHPVVKADDMPSIAANALAIAFGDFRAGYQIVDRIGIRTLRDPFTAKPYVKFYTTRRVGADVVNFDAIKLQKLA